MMIHDDDDDDDDDDDAIEVETWRNVERSKKLLLSLLDADAVLLHLKFNVFAETVSACVQTRDAYWHHAAKQSDCICRPASQQALAFV